MSAAALDPTSARLIAASNSLTLAMHHGAGLPPALLEEMHNALKECASAWHGEECIPRAAVNVLVDLQPALWAQIEQYHDEPRVAIEEALFYLGDWVRSTVEINTQDF